MPTFDLSVTGTFQNATFVVQAVLILLVFCSVVCWAIILEKSVLLVRLFRQARQLEGSDLASLPGNGIAREIFASGRCVCEIPGSA